MKSSTFILFVFVAGILSGCATQPKKLVGPDLSKTEGQWEAKVTVKDLKNKFDRFANLDVLAVKPDMMRMEITGDFGVNIASLLMRERKISYALHTEKKFFQGSLSDSALRPIFQIPLNPQYLFNVFFDKPVTENGWTCQNGADGLVSKCARAGDSLTIEWAKRNGENKKIFIRQDSYEVMVSINTYKTKVQNPDRVFQLETPRSYRTISLQ